MDSLLAGVVKSRDVLLATIPVVLTWKASRTGCNTELVYLYLAFIWKIQFGDNNKIRPRVSGRFRTRSKVSMTRRAQSGLIKSETGYLSSSLQKNQARTENFLTLGMPLTEFSVILARSLAQVKLVAHSSQRHLLVVTPQVPSGLLH